jgi:hypothetical protein
MPIELDTHTFIQARTPIELGSSATIFLCVWSDPCFATIISIHALPDFVIVHDALYVVGASSSTHLSVVHYSAPLTRIIILHRWFSYHHFPSDIATKSNGATPQFTSIVTSKPAKITAETVDYPMHKYKPQLPAYMCTSRYNSAHPPKALSAPTSASHSPVFVNILPSRL